MRRQQFSNNLIDALRSIHSPFTYTTFDSFFYELQEIRNFFANKLGLDFYSLLKTAFRENHVPYIVFCSSGSGKDEFEYPGLI